MSWDRKCNCNHNYECENTVNISLHTLLLASQICIFRNYFYPGFLQHNATKWLSRLSTDEAAK